MLCICASSSATYWHYAQSHWPYDTYLFNLSKGSYWLKLSIKPHLVSENSLFYSPSGLCRISKRAFILDIYIAPLQVNYYSEVLPTTALTMCRRVKTPKHYRQLWVEDLPKVPMSQPEGNLSMLNTGENLCSACLFYLMALCIMSVCWFKVSLGYH